MEYYYAQLDANGVCIGLSYLNDQVDSDNMIRLESYDMSLIGKKHENGVFSEPAEKVMASMPYTPSNTELAWLITELEARLMVSGVIE